MLKVVCAVFLLFFVFSAGTIVGSHFKNQIEHQKTSIAQSVRKTIETPKEADTPAKKLAEPAKDSEKSRVKKTVVKKEEPKKEKKKKVAQVKKRPVKKISKKPISRSKPKNLSGKYTVQLASFPSKVLANKMASELKEKNYDAIVFSGSYKGQTWFRVGIGSYATIGEANKKQRQLVLDKVARGSIISKIR